MKTLLPVIALALAASTAFAADIDNTLDYETITLNNGKKISGYIVEQDASERFYFMPVSQPIEADTCVILPVEVVEVAEAADTVAIADSTVATYDSVVEVVETLTLDTPLEVQLLWDDVEYIERNISLGGILDVIVLGDNTEYVGYIIRNNPIAGIKFRTLDNKVLNFNWDDIVVYSRRALDPKESILRQSPLISTYTFAGSKTLEGIIIEQDYETGLITIETADGSFQRNSARLIKIKNRPNEDLYTPKREKKRRAVY